MHELSNHNAPQVGRAFHNLAIAKQPWILAYGICPSKTEKHWAENKNQHPLNTRNLKLFCIFISHFYLSQVRNRWINRWRNRKTDKLMTPKILSGFFPSYDFPQIYCIRHPNAAEAEGQKSTNETQTLGSWRPRKCPYIFGHKERKSQIHGKY